MIRNVSTGALSLVVKGPGYENGQTFAAAQAVPDCDGLCLVRDRLAVKASYHTAAGGWVQFASADFASSPFAERLFVGAGAHETGVTEAKPTAFRVGKLRLRLSPGMTVILR